MSFEFPRCFGLLSLRSRLTSVPSLSACLGAQFGKRKKKEEKEREKASEFRVPSPFRIALASLETHAVFFTFLLLRGMLKGKERQGKRKVSVSFEFPRYWRLLSLSLRLTSSAFVCFTFARTNDVSVSFEFSRYFALLSLRSRLTFSFSAPASLSSESENQSPIFPSFSKASDISSRHFIIPSLHGSKFQAHSMIL